MCWSGIPLFSIPKGMEQPGREEQCLSWGRTDPSWRCLLPAHCSSCPQCLFPGYRFSCALLPCHGPCTAWGPCVQHGSCQTTPTFFSPWRFYLRGM